jgi:hypothetical protein
MGTMALFAAMIMVMFLVMFLVMPESVIVTP